MYCRKKFISLLLAFVMVIVMGISASATDSTNIPGPKGALTREEETALGITESAGDIALRNQKESMVEAQRIQNERNSGNSISGSIVSPSYEDNYYRTLSVTAFQQDYSYYCGPANTKQVCHYHNGTSNSQSWYATELGTTLAGSSSLNIKNVVNAQTGKGYVWSDITALTTDQYVSRVKFGMDNYCPAILSIIVTSAGTAPSGIPYTTGGHFITTSGLDTSYGDQIRLTDTNGQWTGATWYNIDVVKQVNQANTYMVW